MKKNILSAFAALVVSSTAFGDDAVREAAINRIESSWAEVQLLAESSPMGDYFVDTYRKANPGVSEAKWQPIKKQILSASASAVLSKGGPMDVLFRKTLESLSDAEVERLAALVNDPIYKKFQIASSSPAIQRQQMQEMVKLTLTIGETANRILEQNGLNPVH